MNIKTQAEDWLAEAGEGVDRLRGRFTWDGLIAAFVIVSLFALYAAVLGMSLLGGDSVPDPLDLRSPASKDRLPGRAAAVVVRIESVMPLANGAAAAEAPAGAAAGPSAASLPATPAPPAASPALERSAQHVVQDGETLTSIAALYGADIEQIMRLNGRATDLIFAGEPLVVPGSAAPAAGAALPAQPFQWGK